MAIMLYEDQFQVHTSECDTKDKMRPAAVLDFFQDVASVHAEKLGVGFEDLLKLNLYWVILYEEFEFIKDVSWLHKVKVRTWPKSRTRLEFEREYELRSMDDELLVKGISNWCVINTNSRKLERGDSVVFNGEYYDYTNYPEKLSRRLKISTENPDKEWDYTVLLTDLDHNLHLNNAKYLDIIYNMHVTDKRCKKAQIAFVSEAHLNDIIHITYKKTIDGDCYIGTVNDKVCFQAILTMED